MVHLTGRKLRNLYYSSKSIYAWIHCYVNLSGTGLFPCHRSMLAVRAWRTGAVVRVCVHVHSDFRRPVIESIKSPIKKFSILAWS